MQSDVYWHIYGQDQIRPELRGKLIYLIEVPRAIGSPVLRNIFDPTGTQFPANAPERITALLDGEHHGIIYSGVSKAAVYDVMAFDEPIRNEDYSFLLYNEQIITNSRRFFLIDPDRAPDALPCYTARLLSGRMAESAPLALEK